ncbi:GNAT family N-acetyltransferase [Scrofimicrobium sp. R131]|uniref:GNAT family N-acetyltransferase n=1 Tax=Scrofimicrobium appendicitidis TaxID=3079930 RepID=A0AAU7V5B5_9ACTO
MARITLQADLQRLEAPRRPGELELATLTMYDVPAMASLKLVAYDEPLTFESLLESSDEMRMAFEGAFGTPRDDSFIGAWLGGQLVGAVMAVLDPPWDDAPRGPFVTELMVDPEYRRQGVATALVGELAARAAEWGYDSLTLRLDLRQSPGAYGLYQDLGFSVITEED